MDFVGGTADVFGSLPGHRSRTRAILGLSRIPFRPTSSAAPSHCGWWIRICSVARLNWNAGPLGGRDAQLGENIVDEGADRRRLVGLASARRPLFGNARATGSIFGGAFHGWFPGQLAAARDMSCPRPAASMEPAAIRRMLGNRCDGRLRCVNAAPQERRGRTEVDHILGIMLSQ